MADGMLALSWNNHSTTFCHMLSQIRLKDKYTDATVACEGKFYPVHRIVLSTCSKYFEEMFELTSAGKHPIVLLQDVKKYELEALLSYMYAGVVSVAQKDLARLIKIAELLQIKGLAVPDELPNEKKSVNNQNSDKMNSGHHRSSHSLDSSEGKTSPHRKRRRREDQAPSSIPPPSSSKSYNQDDDDILEIKDTLDKEQVDQLLSGPMEDSTCLLPSNENLSRHQSSLDTGTNNQHPSVESKQKQGKVGNDEMVYIKEELVDDPGEPLVESIKTELQSYRSLASGGDESMDIPHDDQDDYSQTSQGQGPLSESGAEALAGPSGIHEWLSGGDMATGLPSVEDYGGEGSPPTSEHPQSQQMAGKAAGTKTPFDYGRSGLGDSHINPTLNSLALASAHKLHQCPFCSYSSFRKDNVIVHVRRHTGEKPYTCPHCPARFGQKATLNNHIRVHTGEKPYICPVCSQSFAWVGQFKTHVLSHKDSLTTA